MLGPVEMPSPSSMSGTDFCSFFWSVVKGDRETMWVGASGVKWEAVGDGGEPSG